MHVHMLYMYMLCACTRHLTHSSITFLKFQSCHSACDVIDGASSGLSCHSVMDRSSEREPLSTGTQHSHAHPAPTNMQPSRSSVALRSRWLPDLDLGLVRVETQAMDPRRYTRGEQPCLEWPRDRLDRVDRREAGPRGLGGLPRREAHPPWRRCAVEHRLQLVAVRSPARTRGALPSAGAYAYVCHRV